MKKPRKPYLFIIFTVAFSFLFYGCNNNTIKKVSIKNNRIDVEIAKSELEQARGLMFRKSLAGNQGMLFVFDKEARYSFWMKNMEFPLDIIWIDSNRRIVDITKNAMPCNEQCETIEPAAKSKYVLEVNTGFSDRYQLKVGDEVKF